MLKVLILALSIFQNYHIDRIETDLPAAISYSIAEADCTLNENYYSCLMACNQSIEWLSIKDTIEIMPACADIFNRGQ
jgi:hypothetical protein